MVVGDVLRMRRERARRRVKARLAEVQLRHGRRYTVECRKEMSEVLLEEIERQFAVGGER